MNKRVCVLLCLIVAAAGMVTAGGQKDVQSTGTAADTPVTLTWLHFTNDTSQPALDAVIEAFEQKHGIEIQLEFRPGSSEGENLVKTRIAANDMPDLLSYNSGSLFQVLNLEKNFIDLSDLPLADRLIDSFKTTVSSGDGFYGVPIQTIAAGGIVYNKRVYRELGLQVPATWDAFIRNCEVIKAAGKIPVVASYKDDWTAQLLLLADYYNVEAVDQDFASRYTANKAKFASVPAALRGFEKIQEVYVKGLINDEPMSTTYDMAQELLATGDGVHYPMLTFVLSGINEKFPQYIDDIGFFAVPGDDPSNTGATLWMPNNISIPKQTRYPEEGKLFLEFLTSKEGMAAFMSAGTPDGVFAVMGVDLPDTVLPAVKDVLFYVDANKTVAALEFLSPIKGPNLPQISVQAGLALKSPEVCAAEYDRDVEKQAKQLMLTGW
jgi:raffinose/stachyose/melibiose transport system substrate-binding protein